MGSLVKELTISLLLHLGLLVLVVNVTTKNVKFTSPIVIDLTLNNAPAPVRFPVERPRQQVAIAKQTVPPPPMPVQKVQARPERQPVPAAAPQEIPVHPISGLDTAVTDSAPLKFSAGSAASTSAVVSRPVQHDEEKVTPEKAQQRYLKEHFIYIRDLITKKLIYPPIARRMNWSGRVVVAFIVAEDGTVHNIRVLETSGFAILDKSAAETVRTTAPFPKPPVQAEIVVPISFKMM